MHVSRYGNCTERTFRGLEVGTWCSEEIRNLVTGEVESLEVAAQKSSRMESSSPTRRPRTLPDLRVVSPNTSAFCSVMPGGVTVGDDIGGNAPQERLGRYSFCASPLSLPVRAPKTLNLHAQNDSTVGMRVR